MNQSIQNNLVQGFCMSCMEGIELSTGKPCRNGCTKENNKNPPKTGQLIKESRDDRGVRKSKGKK